MAAALAIVMWWKITRPIILTENQHLPYLILSKIYMDAKKNRRFFEETQSYSKHIKDFQSVGIIFWGLIYLRRCSSFIVWLLWSCETFFFRFRLWHCLFGNFQTRLMLPEESGKNLLKVKTRGWVIWFHEFFLDLWTWAFKNGFRCLQTCKHTF